MSLWRPGWDQGRLTAEGRGVFRAVGRAVLDGSLPGETSEQDRVLDEYLDRVDATVAALPSTSRIELSRLLALLSTSVGRMALTGLPDDWAKGTVSHVQKALEAMRTSRLTLPQQAYHALRELSMAAYFSAPFSWDLLGYPGPLEI